MKIRQAIITTLLLTLAGSFTVHAQSGTIGGGRVYELPDWFKLSFLDIQEDASDAGEGNKDVMLYMHLDGCPYCARMLDENFRSGPRKDYIEKNFDVIGINILGGREVQWSDGKSYTEKQLAGLLGVHFTPTIVFLDRHSKKVLQINGYRKPGTFRYAMEYVRSRAYRQQSLAQYIEKRSKQAVYRFMDDPHFSKVRYLGDYQKPLAVIFEDKDCEDCADFHNKVLQSPDVIEELKPYLVVRLDAYSDAPLVDVNGHKTTPRKWAKSLGLSYRPGVILFNEGKQQYQIDGRLYHFHFKEALRYVSQKEYREYANYNSYLAARQNELLRQGINIDLSE
jgi:thioredoxin-related protein